MKNRYPIVGLVLTSLVLVPAQSAERGVTPEVSFEQAVCDLGEVGVGWGTLCEFRFGNAHEGMLKITGVKATCGCTVVQLDKTNR
ncbi:MAG: DUF1573 domain-containing protein [Phycisphaerales bacterium]|nr:MAG: DUF1573 domain-containing protein [Phycisphaerales bacterium]